MANQTLTGVVSMVSEKDWTDSETGENIFLYSFQIDGDKRYFRTGTDDPGIDEGEAIRFAFNTKGNRVDLATVEVIDQSEVEAAPKPRRGRSASGSGGPKRGNRSAGRGASSAGGSKPAPKENWDARAKYWQDKETRDKDVVEPRITFSAAQRDAIALVTAALANGALSFGNAKAAAKFDLLLDFVDNTADRFYVQRMGESFPLNAGNAEEEVEYGDEE